MAAGKKTTPKARSKSLRKQGMQVDGIDAYLARLEGDQLEGLERLRKTIRRILPRAEECISYGLPAFRLDGDVVAGFAATSKGCSYYPFSSATLTTLAKELVSYKRTKGALQFDARKPLPVGLVRKLIKTRIAEGRHR